MDPIFECRFDRGTSLQGPEHVYGGNRVSGQFGRHVACDDGEPKNLDVKHLAGGLYGLQVLPGVTSEPELKLMAGDGGLDRIMMAVKLVADGRSNSLRSPGESRGTIVYRSALGGAYLCKRRRQSTVQTLRPKQLLRRKAATCHDAARLQAVARRFRRRNADE